MEEDQYKPLSFRERKLSRKERERIEARGHARVGVSADRTKLAHGLRDSRNLMVTGRQVHCPPTKNYRDESIIPDGAAFAFMRLHPQDIRPDLLLLAGGQKTDHLARILTYCRNYLYVCCERGYVRAEPTLRDQIITDALRAWLVRVKPQDIAQRAKHLHMRKSDYGRLFGFIYEMLMLRYREAQSRYKRALTGTQYWATPVNWKYRLMIRVAGLADRQPINHRAPAFIPPAPTIAAIQPRPHSAAF